MLPTLFSRPGVVLGRFVKHGCTPWHRGPRPSSVAQAAGRARREACGWCPKASAQLFYSHTWETAEEPTLGFTKSI